MTDLRKAAQQALEALKDYKHSDDDRVSIAMHILHSALAEPEQPKNAWAHLPNAGHIDHILAHLKGHPDKWAVAWDASLRAFCYAAWSAARGAAMNASWSAARVAAWDAAWDATSDAASDAAWDAISALIAWDEAGELLSQPIEAVKAMADKGDHAAVLLYPAMLAMREER